MQQRVDGAGEVLVEVSLADQKVGDLPQIVRVQMIDAARNQRKAVDEDNVLEAPAVQFGDVFENEENEQYVEELPEEKGEGSGEKIDPVFDKPLQELRDKNAVKAEKTPDPVSGSTYCRTDPSGYGRIACFCHCISLPVP